MKYIIFVLLISCIDAAAQSKLDELVAPSSPASSVIGLNATEILTPKSFKALETSLYSNFVTNSRPTIPNDFALEFMPYWAADHGLNAESYLFPGIKEQIVRNSSFSIASTQGFTLGDSTLTNALGFGYRTSIFFSSNNDRSKIWKLRKELSDRQTLIARVSSQVDDLNTEKDILDTAKKIIKEFLIKQYKISDKEAKQITNRIIAEAKKEKFNASTKETYLDSLYLKVKREAPGATSLEEFADYLKNRQGWRVDFAFASMVNFPTNQFDYSFAPGSSLWITPTYRIENDNLDFLKILVVLRKNWYDTHYYAQYFPGIQTYQRNTDGGLGASFDFKKFSFQGEIVWRSSYSEIPAGVDAAGNQLFRKDQTSSTQYVGTFSYKFSEKIVLTYNLGSKFNLATAGNSLFSMLSLNLGFGDSSDNVE